MYPECLCLFWFSHVHGYAVVNLPKNNLRTRWCGVHSRYTTYAHVQFDVNPAGEERHHPYFDAPEDKLAAGASCVVSVCLCLCLCLCLWCSRAREYQNMGVMM